MRSKIRRLRDAEKRRSFIAALPKDTPPLERGAIAAYMEFFPGPHKWENSEEECKAWMRRVAIAVQEGIWGLDANDRLTDITFGKFE